MLIFILFLASGGRIDRNSREALALGLKGLKTNFTSVMNLVIMADKSRPLHKRSVSRFHVVNADLKLTLGLHCTSYKEFWRC